MFTAVDRGPGGPRPSCVSFCTSEFKKKALGSTAVPTACTGFDDVLPVLRHTTGTSPCEVHLS